MFREPVAQVLVVHYNGRHCEVAMIVCKFGGSSVADAEHIKKVKEILDADAQRQILVVSAPGKRSSDDVKVTDLLYQSAEAVANDENSSEILDAIEERYTDILSDLQIDAEFFTPVFNEVRSRIEAGEGAAYAASRGEYLSARILAEYLGWEFLDTENLIIIEADGGVDPISYANLSAALEEGTRYVVPGFYGSNTNGMIQTFSRGGSDITGAILSRASGAEVYENWTDVSGIYRIDPRLVSGAEVIEEMTYQEIRELAGVGAGVFIEEAIAPVFAVQIPINVKNTNDPEAAGTWILPESKVTRKRVVGVAATGGYTRLTIQKLMLNKHVGIRRGLLTMMRVFGVKPAFSLFGIDSIVWFFDAKQANEKVVAAMCDRLADEYSLDSISVATGCAVLGVVGSKINEQPSLVSTITAALEEQGITIHFLNYGSSPTSVLVGVDEIRASEAVAAIYRAIFSE